MSIDRKPRARPARKSGGGTFVGIFIGLVLGVVIALGVALYINKSPMPFQDRAANTERSGESARPDGSQAPIALPGKPGDKPVEKPAETSRFDFYKILPGGEEGAPTPSAGAAAPAAPAAPAADQLFLQAGAFQDAADADNLKARLALIGIEASVQQVILADKGTLNRVRIGPFAKPEDMNRVRSQLAQNGIQANVVKAGAN